MLSLKNEFIFLSKVALGREQADFFQSLNRNLKGA